MSELEPDREEIASRLLAVDSETHLIQDGLLAPPGVCWSWAREPGTEIVEPFDVGLKRFEAALRSDRVLALANAAFDLAVACAEPEGGRWKGDGRLIKPAFDKLHRGEIYDVLIGIALDAIAGGHMARDPNTGYPLHRPPTPEQRARGVKGKQTKRYSLEIVGQLVLGRDDAKENDEYRKRYHELEWIPIAEWPEKARVYPADDARITYDSALALVRRGRNFGYIQAPAFRERLTHWQFEARAAFAMHLASVHGLRTDRERVAELEGQIEENYRDAIEEFTGTGIIRANGKKDTARLKELTLRAYGAKEPCPTCTGSGKVPSEKTGKPINCKLCGGSGLEIPAAMPLTDKGGVSTSRDTLSESGDEVLERYANVSNVLKLRSTYLPFLKSGTERPINVTSNVLVETGRASYDGLIQLLPRGSGIREAFIFREGTTGCSVDYSAVELCTLAQVTYMIFGASAMRDAINAAKKPGVLHELLGARLANVAPDEFRARVKAGDPEAKNFRQAAKAANFGFPGLMGPARLTITKRSQENLRFCVLTGRAPICDACDGACKLCDGRDRTCPERHCRRCRGFGARCGVEKTTDNWGHRIPPTCVACIEFAAELKREYLDTFPEVEEYFKWVKSFEGVDDSLATLTSIGSGFVRGGLHASNLANHGFQHLASRGAKHALWKLSRECYTDEASPLYGSRPVIFAHDEVVAEILTRSREQRHAAAWRMSEIMVDAMKEFVPDVYVEAEPALMPGRWLKDAEKAEDADGYLIPWEPKEKKR